MRLIICFITLAALLTSCKNPAQVKWEDGMQTYTFHEFTLTEALDKTKELGLTNVEAYFGQTLGQGFADSLYLDYTLDENTLTQLKSLFEKNNIKLRSLGVAMYGSEAEWERFFEFAHKMGAQYVSCEPPLDLLDSVEKLALKYNIQVAIHNHPGASVYANPDVVIKALEGRNNIMGVCADPGHWKRVDRNPIEVLQQLKGRVKIIHLKDLNAQMEDTVWGTGVLQVGDIVEELKKQEFDGMMVIEFENFSSNQMNDIKKSIEYYKTTLKK